jgi:hypothetical protein
MQGEVSAMRILEKSNRFARSAGRPRRHSVAALIWWAEFALLVVGSPACSEAAETSPAKAARTTSSSGPAGSRSARKPRSRSFRFDYRFTANGLSAGDKVRVWMPVPPSNREQTAVELSRNLPAKATLAAEPVHGNRIMFLEATLSAAGALKFRVSYRVTRKEVNGLAERKKPNAISAAKRRIYLGANRNVPLGGKPVELLTGIMLKADRLKLARQLYDRVDDHVSYDKSKPGYGRGDAVWVCGSRRGNCSDFHSLFISLARSKGIPARFEIGFPLPEKMRKGTIPGHHCWAHFFVDGRGWVPVDISEADKRPAMKDYYFGSLPEDRVAFSTGRDLVLVPRQSAKPLNFFINPHVEVNGKTWPLKMIELNHSFEDL